MSIVKRADSILVDIGKTMLNGGTKTGVPSKA